MVSDNINPLSKPLKEDDDMFSKEWKHWLKPKSSGKLIAPVIKLNEYTSSVLNHFHLHLMIR